MCVADMIEVRAPDPLRRRPAGRRAARSAAIPGPHTSLGVFLGIKAAVQPRARQGQPRGPAHRAAGRGQRRRRRRAACRGRRRAAVDRRRRCRPRARSWPTTPAARSSTTDEILTLEADVLSPYALGAILTEQIDRRAERADRRRRRQQPARHARRTAQRHRGARHPLRARLCHQRRRDHQRLDRISRRRRCQPGARADRGDSRPARADLGRKRGQRPRSRRRSPTPWRRS